MDRPALIVSVKENYVTLLLPGGRFKKLRSSGRRWSIGEEYHSVPDTMLGSVGRAAGGVAAATLLLLGANAFLSHPLPQATAVISLDLDPSINMVVGGSKPVVIQAMGLDPQGAQLVGQVSVVGMPVVQAVNRFMHQARGDGYLSSRASEVVLGGVFLGPRAPWFSTVALNIKNILSRTKSWHGELVVVSDVGSHSLAAVASAPSTVGRILLWTEAHPGHKPSKAALVFAQKNSINLLVKSARIGSVKPVSQGVPPMPRLTLGVAPSPKAPAGGANPRVGNAVLPASVSLGPRGSLGVAVRAGASTKPVQTAAQPLKPSVPAGKSNPLPRPVRLNHSSPVGAAPVREIAHPPSIQTLGHTVPASVPTGPRTLGIVQTVTAIGPAHGPQMP